MKNKALSILLEGQQLLLDPEKAIYWKEKSFLLLSDLHLGKVGHFRKNGIAVPVQIHAYDLIRIDQLIAKYNPKVICFLGDLFHSDLNMEWTHFIHWISKYPNISMQLVQGNHDILPDDIYQNSRLEVMEGLMEGPFHFSHKQVDTALYNISGHIHPSIRLSGKARQGITLPCFYFSNTFGLLPAFGGFTGTYKIKPFQGDRIFATSGEEVIALMP